jgi:hypothetical protein
MSTDLFKTNGSSPPSDPRHPLGLTSDELLTVADLAAILKCKQSSVYNLTRKRSVRYARQLPVLKLPCGLRFKRSSVMAWLDLMETARGQ